MALTDLISLVALMSLGGIIGAAGLLRLFRLDRLRMEYNRQAACRWHRWQALQGGSYLTCTLCWKKSRRINPSRDRKIGTG
ncbi:MAG: hypothetical protein L0191_11435 [Acidobacteria bacterium]|nr:hypothetical protein [Acidobacteriota bacterium]